MPAVSCAAQLTRASRAARARGSRGKSNCYSLAGLDRHPTSVPPARQVAAPFGVNKGGNNPAYWAYSAEAEFDSWVTVGATDGTANLGSIGIEYDEWDETHALEWTDGAIFWMDPPSAVPKRDEQADAPVSVVLARLTVANGQLWDANLGHLQGKSIQDPSADSTTSRIADWEENEVTFTNRPPPPPPAPEPPPRTPAPAPRTKPPSPPSPPSPGSHCDTRP